MADYDIRPLQLRILKILLAVDKVCKEHGLRYYIMAGTMLGAVRHKGFIPWDDDLDIGMPRADYDLLMSHSKEWLSKPYEAVCAEMIRIIHYLCQDTRCGYDSYRAYAFEILGRYLLGRISIGRCTAKQPETEDSFCPV